jgi:class 3 adenylate cyclase
MEQDGPKPGVERRLAAILAADVAGYSRLMGLDEEGTLQTLKGHRKALVDPTIAAHHGRIVKTTGDGLLVEFASAVHAVQCAVELQRGMAVRNSGVSSDKRIVFRMGINIGDVIEDDGDLFGDGVNVAARLEGISARGGICISRQVLDLIEGKVNLACRELGRQNLKNIARPVEVYGIDLNGEGSLAARILADSDLKQEVRYCRAPDGLRRDAICTLATDPVRRGRSVSTRSPKPPMALARLQPLATVLGEGQRCQQPRHLCRLNWVPSLQ